jgi:tRNA(fMet)-specific endonuclease VapC
MIVRYVFDTDHLTLLRYAQPELIRRISQVETNEIGITMISIEESVRGWLSEIRDASGGGRLQPRKLNVAYDNLRDAVQFLSSFQAASLTESASTQFAELR